MEVGPWVEYSAEAVSALKANCDLAPRPGVEVHVDGNAVVFDFSNVAAPGRFPANEFEGYILDMVRTADAPVLIAALVDWKLTTMDLIQDDLTYDQDRLAVNLAGLSFDSNSFIRLELYLTRSPNRQRRTHPSPCEMRQAPTCLLAIQLVDFVVECTTRSAPTWWSAGRRLRYR